MDDETNRCTVCGARVYNNTESRDGHLNAALGADTAQAIRDRTPREFTVYACPDCDAAGMPVALVHAATCETISDPELVRVREVVPYAGQRQDSVADQLATVKDLAVQHGCYDAADWISARSSTE